MAIIYNFNNIPKLQDEVIDSVVELHLNDTNYIIKYKIKFKSGKELKVSGSYKSVFDNSQKSVAIHKYFIENKSFLKKYRVSNEYLIYEIPADVFEKIFESFKNMIG